MDIVSKEEAETQINERLAAFEEVRSNFTNFRMVTELYIKCPGVSSSDSDTISKELMCAVIVYGTLLRLSMRLRDDNISLSVRTQAAEKLERTFSDGLDIIKASVENITNILENSEKRRSE